MRRRIRFSLGEEDWERDRFEDKTWWLDPLCVEGASDIPRESALCLSI